VDSGHLKYSGLAYLEDVDELGVGDVAVFVRVEVVEDDAEFLSGEENAKLGHELFEFELLQDTILVAVETLLIKKQKVVRQII